MARAGEGAATADGVVDRVQAGGADVPGGQDALWQVLDERGAVVFVHPAESPAPAVEGMPPFAADFLLDTTRAAYLLVRNGIARTYPNIRFILSHAGGFVPYASHRMAVAIAGDTGVARDLLQAVKRGNAEVLFSRLAASPAPTPVRPIATRLRQAAQRAAARLVFKLVQPGRLSKVPKPPTRSPRKPRKTSPSAGHRWPD
ncbi:amidohydrolase family protein [Streptomyces mirabilis]|uniref:amidohydrolase family protein n=1 Tax=Streptomyces mirabilis TaxID=68239 RepID=UPI00371C2BE9